MDEGREQPDWVYKIWAEKGWDRIEAKALPEPPTDKEITDGSRKRMSRAERGALLLRYVEVGRPVVKKKEPQPGQWQQGYWKRLDFGFAFLERADLRNACLEGAELNDVHLEGANLSGAHLEGANLPGAHLERANLIGVHLEGANLSGAHLEQADLTGARLEGADLIDAHLEEARLWSAHLKGTKLWSAHLEGADLTGAVGIPSDRRGASISAETYAKSRWTPATLREWLRVGATLTDFENLPTDAKVDLKRDKEGLTLYFSRPLRHIDRFVLDGLFLGILRRLGRETDCEVAEYVNQGDSGFVRLTASRQDDLLAIAHDLHALLSRFDPSTQGANTAPVLMLHTLHPALITEVDKVAQAILKERTELWARGDDGQVTQRDLHALMQEYARSHRTLIEAIKEGKVGGTKIEGSTITNSVVGDGAQGDNSTRVGDNNQNLAAIDAGAQTGDVHQVVGADDVSRLAKELGQLQGLVAGLLAAEEREQLAQAIAEAQAGQKPSLPKQLADKLLQPAIGMGLDTLGAYIKHRIGIDG